MRKTEVKNNVLILVIVSVALLKASGQGSFSIDAASLKVYRDGNVQVRVEAYVEELEPSVTLPLLVYSDKVWEVIVTNNDGDILDYDLNGYNITIYTLGSTHISLKYYTSALTSKEFDLWTIRFHAPFNLTIEFPENSTILYFNNIPSAIRMEGLKIFLDLPPGEWEIYYEIPITPVSTPMPTTPTKSPTPVPSQNYLAPWQILLAVCIVFLCVFIFMLLHLKGKRRFEGLSVEEAEIVRYIKEKDGRVLEAELRERFPNIPRTSMWRTIKRLEKKGVVQVRKIGLQNVVELK
ncbi:MAG: helix-turn-helix transcriptional regulator [Thermoproteota archaeon]